MGRQPHRRAGSCGPRRLILIPLLSVDRDVRHFFANQYDPAAKAGAVLRQRVPVMLTGMSSAEREARRREWQMRRYPVEVDRVEPSIVERAIADVAEAENVALRLVE